MSLVALIALAGLCGLWAMIPERGQRGQSGPPGGPGGRQGSVGLGMLLQNEGVQNELKLSDDQIAEMREILQEIRGRFREQIQQLQSMASPESQSQMQQLSRELTQGVLGGLANLFTEQQIKRLKQILLQARGFSAFVDPDVRTALKLTEAENEHVKTQAEKARNEVQQNVQRARESGSTDMPAQLSILRFQAVEKVVALLGEQRKQIWKEMIGEPFNLQLEQPRGGPGGGQFGGQRKPGGAPGGQGPFSMDFDEDA